MAQGSLISFRSCAKPMAGRFLRRLLNLNSHHHHQRGRRRRFYLAVLIERPTFAPRYDISLVRNRASHVSQHAIHACADRSRMRWLVAAERRAPGEQSELGHRRGLQSDGIASAASRMIHRVRNAGFTSDLHRITDSRLTSRHVSNLPAADARSKAVVHRCSLRRRRTTINIRSSRHRSERCRR